MVDDQTTKLNFAEAVAILRMARSNGLDFKLDGAPKHLCITDRFIGIYGYGKCTEILEDTPMYMTTEDGRCHSIVFLLPGDDCQLTFHKEVFTTTPIVRPGH